MAKITVLYMKTYVNLWYFIDLFRTRNVSDKKFWRKLKHPLCRH